ncbi:MAG: chemotaxis protein CheX [Desulfobacterales bacterium]|nr:chemotaxis protein CheX [Desulfobacterales bacterium]
MTTTAHFSEILSREAADTMEKLAFVFAVVGDERIGFDDGSAVAVKVRFAGPFGGVLLMLVSSGILQELAANMLGVDEDKAIEDSQRHDALKETLNVICGNLLPAIAGRQAVFNIDAPEMVIPAVEPDEDHWGTPTAVARLGLDQGSCDLFLYVAGDLPENLPGNAGQ